MFKLWIQSTIVCFSRNEPVHLMLFDKMALPIFPPKYDFRIWDWDAHLIRHSPELFHTHRTYKIFIWQLKPLSPPHSTCLIL